METYAYVYIYILYILYIYYIYMYIYIYTWLYTIGHPVPIKLPAMELEASDPIGLAYVIPTYPAGISQIRDIFGTLKHHNIIGTQVHRYTYLSDQLHDEISRQEHLLIPEVPTDFMQSKGAPSRCNSRMVSVDVAVLAAVGTLVDIAGGRCLLHTCVCIYIYTYFHIIYIYYILHIIYYKLYIIYCILYIYINISYILYIIYYIL